jgi:hypothetical protein
MPLLENLEERDACKEDWKEEREASLEEKRADMEGITGPENAPFTQQ